jgi:hypothetical protein
MGRMTVSFTRMKHSRECYNNGNTTLRSPQCGGLGDGARSAARTWRSAANARRSQPAQPANSVTATATASVAFARKP